MPTFEVQVALVTSAEALFDFLVRPTNLSRIMPPSTPVDVIEAPERLELGSRLVVDLDGFGPTQRLTYEVTGFVESETFAETMVEGPLGAWEHCRTISGAGAMVELVERVTFEPPEGLAGLLLSRSRIESSLETSFAFRHRRLRELLEGE